MRQSFVDGGLPPLVAQNDERRAPATPRRPAFAKATAVRRSLPREGGSGRAYERAKAGQAPVSRLASVCVLLWLLLLAAGACSKRRDPIIVHEGMLILENQTSTEWREVLITVNDHFRGGTRSLAPGGRLTAPLRDFQTGFGQKFDRGRMSVFKVVVTAKQSDGTDVRLDWGGRR